MPARIDSRALHDLRPESTPPPSLEPGASDDPLVGQLVADRYRVVRKIADGAQASVYVAKHTLIKRLVALKVLSASMAAERELVKRFLDEGQVAGTMGHPNVVESLDMGATEDGRPFLVLEFLEGTSLADEIHYKGAMDVGRAAYIGTQIASALVAAHARGIIHRDLKPDNIFLTIRDDKKDHVKVLDFGISKIESRAEASKYAGLVVGTPDYMAPEQVTAPATVDARADVFAVGACLYEAISGHAPLDAGDSDDALDAVVRRTPAPLLRIKPGLPRELVQVIERAMNKDRAKRFQTMAELRTALEPFASAPEAASPLSLRSPKISGIQTLGTSSAPPSAPGAPASTPMIQHTSTANAIVPPASTNMSAAAVSGEVPAAPESARGVTPIIAEPPVAPQLIASVPPKASKTPIIVALLIGATAIAAAGVWVMRHPSTTTEPQTNAVRSTTETVNPAGATPAVANATTTATKSTLTTADNTNTTTTTTAAGAHKPGAAAAATADKDPKHAKPGTPTSTTTTTNAVTAPEKASEQAAAPTPDPTPAPAPAPVAENTPPPAAPQPEVVAGPQPIPGSGGVVPFGEGMTRPSPIGTGEIVMTREAREAHVQGTMIVRCTVATSGATQNCRIIKGLPFMDQAVLSAFASHKGSPVTYQGKPIAAEYTFTVKLKD